mgnify:CR=1 FL=1
MIVWRKNKKILQKYKIKVNKFRSLYSQTKKTQEIDIPLKKQKLPSEF